MLQPIAEGTLFLKNQEKAMLFPKAQKKRCRSSAPKLKYTAQLSSSGLRRLWFSSGGKMVWVCSGGTFTRGSFADKQ